MAALPVVFLVGSVMVTDRAIQRDRLNYALYGALVRLDARETERLLAAGTDANALYSLEGPAKSAGLREILARLLARVFRKRELEASSCPAASQRTEHQL